MDLLLRLLILKGLQLLTQTVPLLQIVCTHAASYTYTPTMQYHTQTVQYAPQRACAQIRQLTHLTDSLQFLV